MPASRRKTTHYRNYRIESSPYSHRGERAYEAGIFSSTFGLVDVGHGKTREDAVADAERKIDAHLAGEKPLHNLGLDPKAWADLHRPSE